MYSYYCILIGASLVLICDVESASNKATSSQSYNREDVSLSYNYNIIHPYTTIISLQKKINSTRKPPLLNHQNIQYAPLPLKIHEQKSDEATTQQEVYKSEMYTEGKTSTYDNENIDKTDSLQEHKGHLDPQVEPIAPYNARPRKYVPGYNVDLQAVKNKLMQNGIYASNPNFLVKNKQVNVNYLHPQVANQKQEARQVEPHNKESKGKGTYHQEVKKNKENNIPGKGNNKKQTFYYVKAPKVELNLARARHIARTVHRASVNVNSSFRKLPSLPHEFFSISQKMQPPKIQSFPIKNSNEYIFSRVA